MSLPFLGLSSSVPSITSLLLLWREIPAPAAVGRRELNVEAPFSLVWREQGLGKNLGKIKVVFWVIVQGLFCSCQRAMSTSS